MPITINGTTDDRVGLISTTVSGFSVDFDGTLSLPGNYDGAMNLAVGSFAVDFDGQSSSSASFDGEFNLFIGGFNVNIIGNQIQTIDGLMAASLSDFSVSFIDTGDAEADFAYRNSGSGVIAWNGFVSASEVDAHRWSSLAIPGGNDPGDLTKPNTVIHQTLDYVSGGGCLEIFRPSGTAEGAVWWRSLSALRAPGNGKTEDDPAANGTLPLRTYSPTQNGSEITDWDFGNIGPVSTGTWEWNGPFFIQLQMKFDQRRLDDGFNGGKITYISRTDKSLTAQELVTTYKSSTKLAMYNALDNFAEIPSDVPQIDHVAGQFDTYMYRVVPGDEVEGREDFGSNTQITLFKQDWNAGEVGYTEVIKRPDFGVDYENNFDKAWNALICSGYHNGSFVGTDFYQRYDEIIISTQPIPPKSTFSGSSLETAANSLIASGTGLSSSSYVVDPIGWNSQNVSDDISWQNRTGFWDDFRREVHYMGKGQGGGNAKHYIWSEQTETWRRTGSDIAPNKAGHVWGVTFDHFNGDYYYVEQNPDITLGSDPEEDCERTVRRMVRSTENGQGETNSPWERMTPFAAFDLWSPGDSNIYQPGIGYHPNLMGPGRPGIYGVGALQYSYFDVLNQVWVEAVDTTGTYTGRHVATSVYVPGKDILMFTDGNKGDAKYLIIRAGDADNPTPELIDGPFSIKHMNGAQVLVDPRDDGTIMLLECANPHPPEQPGGGHRVWTSSDEGQTWNLEPFYHPFANATRFPYVGVTAGGTWTTCSIPRYNGGVVLGMASERLGGGTMLWKPG